MKYSSTCLALVHSTSYDPWSTCLLHSTSSIQSSYPWSTHLVHEVSTHFIYEVSTHLIHEVSTHLIHEVSVLLRTKYFINHFIHEVLILSLKVLILSMKYSSYPWSKYSSYPWSKYSSCPSMKFDFMKYSWSIVLYWIYKVFIESLFHKVTKGDFESHGQPLKLVFNFVLEGWGYQWILQQIDKGLLKRQIIF